MVYTVAVCRCGMRVPPPAGQLACLPSSACLSPCKFICKLQSLSSSNMTQRANYRAYHLPTKMTLTYVLPLSLHACISFSPPAPAILEHANRLTLLLHLFPPSQGALHVWAEAVEIFSDLGERSLDVAKAYNNMATVEEERGPHRL